MVTTNTQPKKKREFVADSTRLNLLIEAFGDGRDQFDDGNEATAERIASEIVGKYRRYLRDDNGVNWDGPLYADIRQALEAALARGRHR